MYQLPPWQLTPEEYRNQTCALDALPRSFAKGRMIPVGTLLGIAYMVGSVVSCTKSHLSCVLAVDGFKSGICWGLGNGYLPNTISGIFFWRRHRLPCVV
jgi:hypothetical protein